MTYNQPTQEIIHHRAESYFESVLEGINQAQIKIDFESYIFASDAIASTLSEALIKAANRGVYVRLIIDGAGIEDEFIETIGRLRGHGVRVKIFHPFPWHWRFWPLAIDMSRGIQKFWYLITSINKRNHRKIIVIDKRQVWLGSFNVTQKHFDHSHGGENWRDTGVELREIDTSEINQAFDKLWYRWRKLPRKSRIPAGSPFRLNHTRGLRKRNRATLLSRLDEAKHRIWITNAYFVPDSQLIKKLIYASQRNVEVRLLVPYHSDVTFIPWITRHFYRQLLESGIRIFEYQPGMLHSKTLIVDDWATIGSSNFNRRSLFHDLEVDYVLQREESLKELEQAFIEDLKVSSEQILESSLRRHPLWQRIVGSLLLVLLGYWI